MPPKAFNNASEGKTPLHRAVVMSSITRAKTRGDVAAQRTRRLTEYPAHSDMWSRMSIANTMAWCPICKLARSSFCHHGGHGTSGCANLFDFFLWGDGGCCPHCSSTGGAGPHFGV